MNQTPEMPRLRQDLRLAVVLGGASTLATLAVMPYLHQIDPQRMASVPVPFPALVAIQSMSMFITCTLLVWAGLRMGHRLGLGLPLLQRHLNRHGHAALSQARPGAAVGIGAATAAAIGLLSAWLDPLLLPDARVTMSDIEGARSAFYGLLASFYGGIVEEVQLRLFLMTLLAWGMTRIAHWRRGFDGHLSTPVAWAAIVLAALLFGAGHLSTAATIWGLDTGVVVRTLLLNGIAGTVFGWLYWKRGLEMAILGHFTADVVLHALVPLLLPQTTL